MDENATSSKSKKQRVETEPPMETTPPLTFPRTHLKEELEKFLRDAGLDTQKLASSLSCPPVTTLRVNTLNVTREAAMADLEKAFKDLDEVEGLSRYSNMKLVPMKSIPDGILIPLDKPEIPSERYKEVIVSRKCGESVLRGSDVFIPGILGMTKDIRKGDTVAVIAYTGNQVKKGHAKPLLTDRAYVGCGILEVPRKRVFTPPFQGIAIRMTTPLYSSHPLNNINRADIFLQNYPSMLAAYAVDPQPGDRVLDMCASPGGKTTHLATLMEGKGEVIAFDRVTKKAQEVNELAERFGLKNVRAFKFDSTQCLNKEAVSSELVGVDMSVQSFDRILADVPCTAMGNRPRLEVQTTVAEIQSQGAYQRKFIDAAVPLLKEGGVLVYSTCSVAVDENEANVRYALDNHECLKLSNARISVGHRGIGPLSEDEKDRVQRFQPYQDTADGVSTIGFFMAKFVKKSS